MKYWLKQFFSLDQAKTSTTALIVSLIMSLVFGFTMYYIHGDITATLENIIITLIISVGGIAGAGLAHNYFTNKNIATNASNNTTNNNDQNNTPSI